MDFSEALTLSLANIRRHKLRSLLTTLGVILGIGAVIATVTLGASFEAFFVGEFTELFAPDAFVVSVGEIRDEPGQGGFFFQNQPIFTDHDMQQVESLALVKTVYPLGFLPADPIRGIAFGNRTLQGVSIVSTLPEAYGGSGYRRLETGRSFALDSEAVIGFETASLLSQFTGTDVEGVPGTGLTINFATGQSLNVTVVGVVKDQPGGVNNFVAISQKPYSTIKSGRVVPGSSQNVTVYELLAIVASTPRDVKASQESVLQYLRTDSDAAKFLRVDSPEADFITISVEDVVSFIQQQIGQFAAFIASIGLISLIVGSIGISNILMVAVTERTREIGVMKATGARKRDILQLFLLEALIIGAFGAIIGVGVGVGLGLVLTRFGFFSNLSLPLVFRYEWFPISVGVGVGVGLISGLYPAWRAAKVNPVEALRYE